MSQDEAQSRRAFVADVGRLATVVPLAGCAAQAVATAPTPTHAPTPANGWDLSWMEKLTTATDRAVFDWPTLGDADDSIVLQIAARFLDNCDAAYAPATYKAIAVLNIRTTAIAAAMTDGAWARYSLAAEYKVKDAETTNRSRNPFWRPPAGQPPAPGAPPIEELVRRGSLVLVCDFAMGHLSTRLAAKVGRTPDEVHDDLRHSLVPGAYAVPSGIFGLSRAQNSGCAFVRM